jgi:hypothetical protein
MFHLKLATVDFKNLLFIAMQQLSDRLYSLCLARTRWSKQ